MAVTLLSDVIVPELFEPYVIGRTKEKSALFKSGIVTNNPTFDRLASEASAVHNMPFFEDLTGESEPMVEGAELTAKKIASNKDVATTIRRANMWAASPRRCPARTRCRRWRSWSPASGPAICRRS